MNWISVNTPARSDLIDAVATAVSNAGSDDLGVFGGTWRGGYWIQQHPAELAKLVCLLATHGPYKSSLEIGIAAGGTTRFIRDMMTIEKTAVIDDGNHPRFAVWQSENRQHVANLSEFIGDSHSPEAAEFVASIGEKFDLVAIDGDHSASGVRADWELVKPHLADGAIVWFHDTRIIPEVREFWGELRLQYRVMLETDVLGIGVLRI